MEIRIFKESDRQAVISLWEACELTRPWNNPNKDIDRKVAFQPNLFYVGVLAGEIIATAMAGYDGHRGSVFYLAVKPTLQSKGYGKKLMAHIEHHLQAMGCPKLNIIIRSTNVSVLDFYGKQDYKTDPVVCVGKRLIPDK